MTGSGGTTFTFGAVTDLRAPFQSDPISGGTGITVGKSGGSRTVGLAATTGSGAVALAGSPAFTGSPTAPTQTAGDNSTKLATTAYVATAVATAGYTMSTSGVGHFAPYGYTATNGGFTPGSSTTAACSEFMTNGFVLNPSKVYVISQTADGTNWIGAALYDLNGNRLTNATSTGVHVPTNNAFAVSFSGTPSVSAGPGFICYTHNGTGTIFEAQDGNALLCLVSNVDSTARTFTIGGVSFSGSTITWPSTLGTRTVNVFHAVYISVFVP